MSADGTKNAMKETMEKALGHLQKEFRLVRTGRANPVMVESIHISAYGAPMPLKQAATIAVPEARQLLIKPFDVGLLKDIEKALLASDLGVTPQNDGKVIRLTFPPLTEDRRKKLATELKAKGEDAKVTMRNARRDAIKVLDGIQKDGTITEDDLKKSKDQVQNMLKDYEGKVDSEVKKKTDEIMEI